MLSDLWTGPAKLVDRLVYRQRVTTGLYMATLYKLSARSVTSALRPGLHSDGGGLYLKVKDTGSRSFVFRYNAMCPIESKSKAHALGLGSTREVTLAQAREKANVLRSNLKEKKIDPMVARQNVRLQESQAALALGAGVTFRQSAEAYIRHHEGSWKNDKHASQWPSTLERYAYSVIGDMPVADIKVGHIIEILEPIWLTKRETASRVRGRIERVLSRCRALGQIGGANPAAYKDNLEHILASQKRAKAVIHHAAMSWTTLPAFMALLKDYRGLGALALRLTILTTVRTTEILDSRWSEFDLEGRVWTIPATRMKAGKDHRVPLSVEALEVLRLARLKSKGSYVFANKRTKEPLSNMVMLTLLKRNVPGMTVHGFRSTFRDWCSEQTNHPREVCEAALAHTISDAVERAYRRTDLFDRRVVLMSEWAVFCTSPAEPLVTIKTAKKSPSLRL
jgi:integrase